MPNNEIISLREYVDLNFELRDRAFKAHIKKAEDALELARNMLEHRLEGLNELRGNVLSREEFTVFERDVNRRVEALERWQSRLIGVGLVLIVVSGLVGAMIVRLITR